MPKLPRKKKWPKGLKRRLSFAEKKKARLAENKKIESAIAAAYKKVSG